MSKRKGSKSINNIDPAILLQLNLGKIESANLVEMLAVNFDILLKSAKITAKKIEAKGIVARIKEASFYMKDWQEFSNHKSDSIRSIASFSLAANQNLSFEEKLNSIKIFAADPHFNVREWAWLAMRNQIIENLDSAILLLENWALDGDENIRRFASEATRPRGVWCAHIKELKINPQKCQKILEILKEDSSKYVQNSVGNWLNDAAKTNEIWVRNLTKKWLQESKAEETIYIVRRGLRYFSKDSATSGGM